jgi:hypothetical protein
MFSLSADLTYTLIIANIVCTILIRQGVAAFKLISIGIWHTVSKSVEDGRRPAALWHGQAPPERPICRV